MVAFPVDVFCASWPRMRAAVESSCRSNRRLLRRDPSMEWDVCSRTYASRSPRGARRRRTGATTGTSLRGTGSRTDIACGLRNRLAAADGLDRCRRPGEGYPHEAFRKRRDSGLARDDHGLPNPATTRPGTGASTTASRRPRGNRIARVLYGLFDVRSRVWRGYPRQTRWRDWDSAHVIEAVT